MKKLVGVMTMESISSNFRCVVWSTVAHEFNAVRNMAPHYFRLRYAGRFANMYFSRKEILEY